MENFLFAEKKNKKIKLKASLSEIVKHTLKLYVGTRCENDAISFNWYFNETTKKKQIKRIYSACIIWEPCLLLFNQLPARHHRSPTLLCVYFQLYIVVSFSFFPMWSHTQILKFIQMSLVSLMNAFETITRATSLDIKKNYEKRYISETYLDQIFIVCTFQIAFFLLSVIWVVLLQSAGNGMFMFVYAAVS